MKKYLYVSFLVILIVSCKSKKIENQENEVFSMINKLDAIDSVFKKNKVDSIVELRLAGSSLLIRIKRNYNADKVDLKFGRLVDEFKELQMLFEFEKEEGKNTLPGEYAVINTLVQEERTSLNELYEDITNGKGDKQKYEDFIVFENRKLNLIDEMFDHYIKRKNKYIPRFYKCYNELDKEMTRWEKENLQKKIIQ